MSYLTDSVQLISDKFDEYEKDKKGKDEPTELQMQVRELTDKVSNLSLQVTFFLLTNRVNIPGELPSSTCRRRK